LREEEEGRKQTMKLKMAAGAWLQVD